LFFNQTSVINSTNEKRTLKLRFGGGGKGGDGGGGQKQFQELLAKLKMSVQYIGFIIIYSIKLIRMLCKKYIKF